MKKTIVMAIDVGSRRIGVAVSDDRHSMALPLETVEARPVGKSLQRLARLMEDYDVGEIVVGWPVDMRGREGRAVDRVRELVKRLKEAMRCKRMRRVEIHRWDERMSSMVAGRLLDEMSVSGRRRKDMVDQLAACDILEGFLASRENGDE